ncbi:MAG: pitrilysin family protein [Patescibacteria group bacterium]
MKGTQAVTVLVLVGVGARDETKELNGISHFLEHAFFKGTKKRPDTLSLIEPLDRVGGMCNAFTGEEYTGFWAKTDSKHTELVLDWLSDIYLNSKFEAKEIEKEKGVIMQELKMYLDTPMSYVRDVWEEVLYGNQPAGWSIIGKKENIESFKRKDFVSYKNKHYAGSNTIVCVAGKIDPVKVKKLVNKYFSHIEDRKIGTRAKTINKQEKPQSLIHFKKTDQTHFCLGVRGYNRSHKSRYVQALLSTILGGYMSSRIWMAVRGRQGLAYYVRTTSESLTDTGFLVTQAGVGHERCEKTINLILKEYRKLKTTKIDKKELQKAKDNLKGTFTLSLESSDVQASFYAEQELLSDEIMSPEQKFREIDKITSEDILKTAKDLFKPKNLNLALVGPFKDKQKFEKLLKI